MIHYASNDDAVVDLVAAISSETRDLIQHLREAGADECLLASFQHVCDLHVEQMLLDMPVLPPEMANAQNRAQLR